MLSNTQNFSHLTSRIKSDSAAQRKPLSIVRMWLGGPLRHFTENCSNHSHPAYSSKFRSGFTGAYVCERCLRIVPGVFRSCSQWVCDRCRSATTSQEMPVPGGTPSDSATDALMSDRPFQERAKAAIPEPKANRRLHESKRRSTS